MGAEAAGAEWAERGGIIAVSAAFTRTIAQPSRRSVIFQVRWDDGAHEDVGYFPLDGVDELVVHSGSDNVVVLPPESPGNDEKFWAASVAQGAESECVTSVIVNWTVCGAVVASGLLPLYLQMPTPISASLHPVEPRLAPKDSDATLPGVGVPSTTAIFVSVTFEAEDGSTETVDFTFDSRVSYAALSDGAAACARTDGPSLTVLANASCATAMVGATVSFKTTTLVVNASLPVVRVASAALDFIDSTGAAVVDAVGLVPCKTDIYTSAIGRMQLYLDDDPSIAFDVSSGTQFTSSDPSIVSVSGTALTGVAVGSALISAAFGSAQRQNRSFEISGEVLDEIVGVTWNLGLPYVGTASSFVGVADATQPTAVDLHFASGIVWADLSSDIYEGWADITDLVFFSSSVPDAIAVVDDLGTLAIRDNWYEAVGLTATVLCKNSVSTERTVLANLAPAAMDIDLGAFSGAQFDAAQVGSMLSFAVRAMPQPGAYLRSVLLKITAASGSLSTAPPGHWASATPIQFPVTAATDVPGEPQTLAIISGANVPDAASSSRGVVELGTLHAQVARLPLYFILYTLYFIARHAARAGRQLRGRAD